VNRDGLPMPNESDGATPQLPLCTTSRPATPDEEYIAARRTAAPEIDSSGALESTVMRE
jgi:hypothetical protein